MIARVLVALLVFTLFATADTQVTLVDQFGAASACTVFPGSDPTYANCDTIGDVGHFDIEKAIINFNSSAIAIDYYLNYNNSYINPVSNTLGSYNYAGVFLSPGDILFSTSQNSGYIYGIALSNHNGFVPGQLYEMSNDPVLAHTALGLGSNPSEAPYFRKTQPVWLSSASFDDQVSSTSLFDVSANPAGSSAEYMVSLRLDGTASDALYDAATANGGSLYVHFASMTCGNDILEDRIHVPEPTDYVLLSTVVGFLGLGLRRRRTSLSV
jgi:hypothetical protein